MSDLNGATRYDVDIDMSTDTSHTRAIRLIGRDRRVLDLGCATGAVAKVLSKNGCDVVGVEVDPEAAAMARQWCDEVIVGDLADPAALDPLVGRQFDVVLAGDVLEHLVEPEAVLRRVTPLLNRDGYLVTSVPNVAHGAVRLALMKGRFQYTEVGLLDRTHLRFYTLTSLTEMLAAGGFTGVYVERLHHPIEQAEPLAGVDLDFPESVWSLLRDDPEALVYQYLVLAYPSDRMDDPVPALLSRLVQESADLVADRNAHSLALRAAKEQHTQELGAFQQRHDEELASLREQRDREAGEARQRLQEAHLAVWKERDRLIHEEEHHHHTRNHAANLDRAVTALTSQVAELQARVGAGDVAQRTLEEVLSSRWWRAGRPWRSLRTRVRRGVR